MMNAQTDCCVMMDDEEIPSSMTSVVPPGKNGISVDSTTNKQPLTASNGGHGSMKNGHHAAVSDQSQPMLQKQHLTLKKTNKRDDASCFESDPSALIPDEEDEVGGDEEVIQDEADIVETGEDEDGRGMEENDEDCPDEEEDEMQEPRDSSVLHPTSSVSSRSKELETVGSGRGRGASAEEEEDGSSVLFVKSEKLKQTLAKLTRFYFQRETNKEFVVPKRGDISVEKMKKTWQKLAYQIGTEGIRCRPGNKQVENIYFYIVGLTKQMVLIMYYPEVPEKKFHNPTELLKVIYKRHGVPFKTVKGWDGAYMYAMRNKQQSWKRFGQMIPSPYRNTWRSVGATMSSSSSSSSAASSRNVTPVTIGGSNKKRSAGSAGSAVGSSNPKRKRSSSTKTSTKQQQHVGSSKSKPRSLASSSGRSSSRTSSGTAKRKQDTTRKSGSSKRPATTSSKGKSRVQAATSCSSSCSEEEEEVVESNAEEEDQSVDESCEDEGEDTGGVEEEPVVVTKSKNKSKSKKSPSAAGGVVARKRRSPAAATVAQSQTPSTSKKRKQSSLVASAAPVTKTNLGCKPTMDGTGGIEKKLRSASLAWMDKGGPSPFRLADQDVKLLSSESLSVEQVEHLRLKATAIVLRAEPKVLQQIMLSTLSIMSTCQPQQSPSSVSCGSGSSAATVDAASQCHQNGKLGTASPGHADDVADNEQNCPTTTMPDSGELSPPAFVGATGRRSSGKRRKEKQLSEEGTTTSAALHDVLPPSTMSAEVDRSAQPTSADPQIQASSPCGAVVKAKQQGPVTTDNCMMDDDDDGDSQTTSSPNEQPASSVPTRSDACIVVKKVGNGTVMHGQPEQNLGTTIVCQTPPQSDSAGLVESDGLV